MAWRGTVAGWGDRGQGSVAGRRTHEDPPGRAVCALRTGEGGGVALPVSPAGSAVVHWARGELGCPWRWGAPTPLCSPRSAPGEAWSRFAEGRGFRLAQGSGPQRGRSLTVRRQPAGVRPGPATPPWGLPGRVRGERGPPRPVTLFCSLESGCPAPSCARKRGLAVLWVGSRAPRLPSGGARADILPSSGPSANAGGAGHCPAGRALGLGPGPPAHPARQGPRHTVPWACGLQPPGPFVFISRADPARSPALAGPFASGLLASCTGVLSLAWGWRGKGHLEVGTWPGGLLGGRGGAAGEPGGALLGWWMDGRGWTWPFCIRGLLWPLRLLCGHSLGGVCCAPLTAGRALAPGCHGPFLAPLVSGRLQDSPDGCLRPRAQPQQK